MRWIGFVMLAGVLISPVETRGQAQYDERFFAALRSVFDTFNRTDLQRVFQSAPRIACTELLGDWRTAAFFSEDNNLERWFYKTFEEVQADLSRYIFQGDCKKESADLDVVSRFPVRDSMDAYNRKEIEFDRIGYKVNAPVKARFDSRAKAYAFELPYLFVTGRNGDNSTYSMMPPNAAAKYAQEVTNRWECKSVKNAELTYRFLLCRTAIVPRNPTARNSNGESVRGKAAYILLTDGKEARSTTVLSFATDDVATGKSAATMSKIADLSREDFLLRFVKPSWESRIASTTVLAGGQFVAAESGASLNGDHCEWRPSSPATSVLVDDSDKTTQYYLTRSDRDGSSPASFQFDARTPANVRLGLLRCAFPGTDSAAALEMTRLLSIFGDHLRIEFR
jgi:hypothetical protein